MAGDWIKMRVDLYRDPKVIVMADALMAKDGELARYVNQNKQRDMTVTRNVMRNVTVGALVSIWGVARKQGKRIDDALVLADCCVSVLDDIAELPGIGEAMEAAGWVAQTEDGLLFPRFFEEHNTDYEEQKAKNRERQARYRAKKQAENSNVTVTLRNAPEREKRREEVIQEPPTEVCGEMPKTASSPPAVPPVMVFPIDGKARGPKTWGLTAIKLAEYKTAFPHLDVDAEFRAALQWCRDNPTRRKTATGMAGFLTRWLSKSQNARGSNGNRQPAATPGEAPAPFVAYDFDAYLESQKLTPKAKP